MKTRQRFGVDDVGHLNVGIHNDGKVCRGGVVITR